MKIIHIRDWTGQYSDFQRFFRVKHSLNNTIVIDFDYDVISLDYQAKQLSEMINASYIHENITVSERDILQWKKHETFCEDLCIYINADGGKMVASGMAEYDETCREGIIEWIQVLPEYRNKGLGKKIVTALLSRLKCSRRDNISAMADFNGSVRKYRAFLRVFVYEANLFCYNTAISKNSEGELVWRIFL